MGGRLRSLKISSRLAPDHRCQTIRMTPTRSESQMGTVNEPVIGGPEQEQGNGRGGRPLRRHALLAGASAGAAALIFAGLGGADARGAPPLATAQNAAKVKPGGVAA